MRSRHWRFKAFQSPVPASLSACLPVYAIAIISYWGYCPFFASSGPKRAVSIMDNGDNGEEKEVARGIGGGGKI